MKIYYDDSNLHVICQTGDHIFGRGRDKEEANSEVKMDEEGRSSQREVGADQEEVLRIKVSRCLRGGSMP